MSERRQQVVLQALRDDPTLTFTRRLTIPSKLLERILEAAPHDLNHRPYFKRADFSGATFEGYANFGAVEFESQAHFNGATFTESADFQRVVFQEASFRDVTFKGEAKFAEAHFQNRADFGHCKFEGAGDFGHCRFAGGVDFTETQFSDSARFSEAKFDRDATFEHMKVNGEFRLRQAYFERAANFSNLQTKGAGEFPQCRFAGGADFTNAQFSSLARFTEAKFDGDTTFKRMKVNGELRLRQARFQGSCTLRESVLSGGCYASGAQFGDKACFVDTTWDRDVFFEKATFAGTCRFRKARLRGNVYFSGAEFNHQTSFFSAIFEGWAEFGGTRFTLTDTEIDFREVTFNGRTRFSEATFAGTASFLRATFEQEARFRNATFHMVTFESATFKGTVQLGLLTSSSNVILDDASFERHGQITVTARTLSCTRSRFPAGGHLRVNADFSLEEANISGPLIVSGHAEFPDDLKGSNVRSDVSSATGNGQHQPVLYSLRRANVAGLVLTGVSLRSCRFEGAQNLDLLRVEGGNFAPAHDRLPWDWRRVIAEEATSRRWRDEPWPDWLHSKSTRLPALQIAAIYRALRKGKEDTKDEPGATDFYFGEMEMRRRATKKNSEPEQANSYTPVAERMILHAYWLVSGYGLRAWRALTAVLLALILFAYLFTHGGFATDRAHCAPPPVAGTTCDNSFGDAVIFGARTAIGLPTDPRPILTTMGQVGQIGLRITVPVLLGLALLAIRARVKR